MTYLFISNVYPPEVYGGYEILCQNVALAMATRGDRVHVLTSGVDRQAAGGGAEIVEGIPVHRTLELFLPFGTQPKGRYRFKRRRVDRSNAATTRETIAAVRPDVVFIWSQLRLGLGPAMAAESSAAMVCYTFNDTHPLGFARSETWYGALLDRFLGVNTIESLRLRHTTAISATLLANLRAGGLALPSCTVIYQGIPTHMFTAQTGQRERSTRVRILYAGQLHRYKGVHTLLEALHALSQDHSDARSIDVSIVGAGDPHYERDLHRRAQEISVPIAFRGRIPHEQMPAVYAEHDILVFPSIWDEPFGLSHLEAMASGVAVISTDHAGPGEFLRNGENALLFKKEDHAGLASAIRRLVRDPSARQQIASAGTATARATFSLEAYVERLSSWITAAFKQRIAPSVSFNTVHIPRRFVQSNWGGTETVVLETVRALNRAGSPAQVFTSAALSTPGPADIQGVPVRRFRYTYPAWGLSKHDTAQLDLRGGNLVSFALQRALQSVEPLHLVHLHTGKRLGAAARVVCRRRGVPYVVSLHGSVYRVPEAQKRALSAPLKGSLEWGKVIGWILGSRHVLRDAAGIICVDREEVPEVLTRFPGKPVIHLPNGVDTERFGAEPEQAQMVALRNEHAIPSDAEIILHVGRIDPQKNQIGAAEAFAQLDYSNAVHLVLIGNVTDPGYHQQLVSRVDELGIAAQVTIIPGIDFHGPEIVAWYHTASVFVLSSIHEPFGIVVLEAWAAGCPVVATEVGGVPSFAKNDHNALLVPPYQPPEMARACERLLLDSALATRIAQQGRNDVQASFSWDSIVNSLLSFYAEVVGS